MSSKFFYLRNTGVFAKCQRVFLRNLSQIFCANAAQYSQWEPVMGRLLHVVLSRAENGEAPWVTTASCCHPSGFVHERHEHTRELGWLYSLWIIRSQAWVTSW